MFGKFLLNCTSLLLKFIPRNKHLWITGRTNTKLGENDAPTFFDNSKYFYLYLVNETNEHVYWITSSDKEYELLKSLRLPVIHYSEKKSIWIILRARYFFHHYGINQISEDLQRGSIQMDFWHGTPLKKIGYDVVSRPENHYTRFQTFLNKGGCEYSSSTSRFLSENILAKAFATTPDKILNFGYPRMDIMGNTKESILEFCKQYSKDLLPYIEICNKFKKIILYMPTWRDYDEYYFKEAQIDYERMSAALKKIDAVFFIKLHPMTKYVDIPDYDNIVQIDNDVDMYPFLTYVDFLVTDYSSIYFDFLVLDREIIFIPYDFEQYVSNRQLYFEYDSITPGIKYKSFNDFIQNLNHITELNYSLERNRVRQKLYDDYQFDACKRTYDYLRNI